MSHTSPQVTAALAGDLPPVALLRAFDAAGRHGSFKAAADYLRVTPSTISHQIADLEQWLGVSLFERRRSGLSLTAAGEALLLDVADAFARLRSATALLRQRGQPTSVRISANPFFAGEVLVPLIARFDLAFPECSIHVEATEQLQDPRDGEVDFCVRTGEGDWPGLEVERLYSLFAFPAVSSGFVGNAPALISYRFRGVDVWQAWRLRGGEEVVENAAVRRFGGFGAAMRACAEGLGVTLALWPVAQPWFAQSRLRRYGRASALPVGAAFLLSRPLPASQVRMRLMRRWLRDALVEAVSDCALPP